MIVQINSLATPKELGHDAYSQWLKELTVQIQKAIPQAQVYQHGCDIDAMVNQILIVQDTFSFGKGGHMRTITHQLEILLFAARQLNITVILLETNSKHDWIIDSASQIRCDSVGTFISLVHLIKGL